MERPTQEDRLSAYFDGELPSEERSALETQISSSAELRRTLEEFERQRNLFKSLERPSLSAGFSARVMDRVLAAAAESGKASATAEPPATLQPRAASPPTTKATPHRNSYAVALSLLAVAAAVVGIGFFALNALRPPVAGPIVAQGSDNEEKENTSERPVIASADPPPAPIESPLSPNVQPESREPEIAAARTFGSANPEPEPETVAESRPALRSMAPQALVRPAPPEANNAARSDSGAQLAANNDAAKLKATMTTPPKAYRVQVESRSVFDASLNSAGAAVYYARSISPPADPAAPLRADVLPDPEYVLIEGTEEQLAEVVEKLKGHKDLVVAEAAADDDEAALLLAALTNIDAAGQSIRPAEAQEGEVAAFTFSPKALMTLLPPTPPSTDSPSFPVESAARRSAPQAMQRRVEEPKRWVPRVVFILDVQVGEAEGPKPASDK